MVGGSDLPEEITWNEGTTHTARGLPRTEILIRHKGLHKMRVIRDASRYVATQKAAAQIESWVQMWGNRRYMQDSTVAALQRTKEAQALLHGLQSILHSGLCADHHVEWSELEAPFPEPRPSQPKALPEPERPTKSEPPEEEPRMGIGKYSASWNAGFWDTVIQSRWKKKEAQARGRFDWDHEEWTRKREALEADYATALEAWESECRGISERNSALHAEWEKRLASWEQRKEQHETAERARIDSLRESFVQGEKTALEELFSIVLERSEYPECFPGEFAVACAPETKMVVCDYQLPAPCRLPTLKEVVYVKSRKALNEKHLSKKDSEALYDSVVYQTCLRTIHEIFAADESGLIDLVTFNGWVRDTDPATGKEINPCIVSLQVTRQEFQDIDLERVDPKACFKVLKGVGSTKLHALAPIAPLLRLNTEDGRFIEGRDVAGGVSEGTNLAAMDWEEFEHLIRQIFEAEFAEVGAEVKVTQASRDRGVDAVIFDPRPIYGGKIVLQAKRYTNTVGVDAVRDLYGTVINEGANKGILVTTSDFGPEAHKFVADKPIELLSGGNLLHLLAKHGHRAHIDLAEARQAFAEKEADERHAQSQVGLPGRRHG